MHYFSLNDGGVSKSKVRIFLCMTGNTDEPWSCCGSRLDDGILWVLLSFSFLQGKHGIKMTARIKAQCRQVRMPSHLNEQIMECAQAMILGKCSVGTVKIAARLGINFSCLWGKPLVYQPYLCHTPWAHVDYKWTTWSMTLSALELQYGQVSAVLPIMQQNCSIFPFFKLPHIISTSVVH